MCGHCVAHRVERGPTVSNPIATAKRLPPALLPAVTLSGPPSARRAEICETAAPDLSVVHVPSIAHIDPQAWNRLFPGSAVDWGYLRGCERSDPEDFVLSALAVYHGDVLVGAAPLFRLDYRLDMTLGAGFKPIGDWLARFAPRLVKVPVIGMGSPMTEECPIGILPGLDAEGRRRVMDALLAGLEVHAKAERVKVVALKDVRDRDTLWAGEPLADAGFSRMASLPVASLALPYDTFEEYLKTMPSRTRSDMRAKLKKAERVETEMRDCVDDVYDEIIALYRATRDNRKASYESFDDVSESYFREVMKESGGKARVMLCRLDGRLVGFCFILVDSDRVDGKLLGLDYSISRELNLYFFMIMTVIKYCIDNRIPELQLGQTAYTVKLRLGCKLRRSWVYYKHRGLLLGPLFRFVGARLSYDAVEPELAKLGAKVVYADPAS